MAILKNIIKSFIPMLLVTIFSCESDPVTNISTGSLTVTVLDSNSNPVNNITVKVVNSSQNSKITDSNGKCTFSNLTTISTIILLKVQGYRSVYERFILKEGNNSKTIYLEPVFELNEGFESGSFSSDWSFSGSNYWFITDSISHSGNYCAQSGSIQNYQSCSISLTVEIEKFSEIRFWYKLDTDYYDHYFKFYINGYQQFSRSGNYDWAEFYYYLNPGTNQLTWEYDKQYSGYGSVGVWIDDIEINEQ